MAVEQKKQTRLGQGGPIINSERRTAAASQSKLTFKNQLALPSSTGSNGKNTSLIVEIIGRVCRIITKLYYSKCFIHL